VRTSITRLHLHHLAVRGNGGARRDAYGRDRGRRRQSAALAARCPALMTARATESVDCEASWPVPGLGFIATNATASAAGGQDCDRQSDGDAGQRTGDQCRRHAHAPALQAAGVAIEWQRLGDNRRLHDR
jgi:hypothetical protein